MELPREIVGDILSRIPIADILPFWEVLSTADVRNIARDNMLPRPSPDLPILEQLLDLQKNSELSKKFRLSIAIHREDVDLVLALIGEGVSDYYEVANTAAEGGKLEVVKAIAELGHDVSEAAAFAAQNGHKNVVEMLLEAGLADRESVLVAYLDGGHSQLARELIYPGEKIRDDVMEIAINGGHVESVQMLLEMGFQVTEWMLPLAASLGHYEITECLLLAGAPGIEEAISAVIDNEDDEDDDGRLIIDLLERYA